MKTRILMALIAIFTMSGLNTFAQEGRPSKEQMKEQRDADVAKLNLSEDQKSTFDEISKRYGKELKAIRQADISREEKMAKAEPLIAAKNKEMNALLDDTQYKTYLEIQDERKKHMKKRAH